MSFIFERHEGGERAILVHVQAPAGPPGDPGELRELVAAAGAEPVHELTVRRRAADPATFIGRGNAELVRDAVADLGAEVVIVDHPLGPAQERNLERIARCRVLDRISLILDIFAQRARSYEGKLQVELAQLRHLSTRLVRGWTHLERQKGGIGLRGPGETQLETDRRLLQARIRQIRKRLAEVEQRRGLSRRARDRAGVPVISLVGYTNAGKSTLFNALTGAGVQAANRLFETLDPTLRRVELPDVPAFVLADTVGFIRQLPHELVAAFRATLEETLTASLLLHVIDASDPDRRTKVEQVREVLDAIGAGDVVQLEIYNKIDRIAAPDGEHGDDVPGQGPRIDSGPDGLPARVWLSARDGSGMELLTQALAEHFRGALAHLTVRVPLARGRLRANLFESAVTARDLEVDADGWLMELVLRGPELERLDRREGLRELEVRRPAGDQADAPPDEVERDDVIDGDGAGGAVVGDDIPEGGVPEGGIPEGGIPEGGIIEDGITEGGITEDGIPEGGIPEDGSPEGGIPEDGIPEGGITEDGTPEGGIPERGISRGGISRGGRSEGGPPEGGVTEDGIAGSAVTDGEAAGPVAGARGAARAASST